MTCYVGARISLGEEAQAVFRVVSPIENALYESSKNGDINFAMYISTDSVWPQ